MWCRPHHPPRVPRSRRRQLGFRTSTIDFTQHFIFQPSVRRMHELKIGKEVLAEHVSGQRWRMARGCCAPFAPVLMLLMLLLACPRDSPLHRNVPSFSPRRPHRVALTHVTLTVPHPSFNLRRTCLSSRTGSTGTRPGLDLYGR